MIRKVFWIGWWFMLFSVLLDFVDPLASFFSGVIGVLLVGLSVAEHPIIDNNLNNKL